jgi:hypothetical protein
MYYTCVSVCCVSFARSTYIYYMLSENNKGTGNWEAPRELCQFILSSMFFSEFSLHKIQFNTSGYIV